MTIPATTPTLHPALPRLALEAARTAGVNAAEWMRRTGLDAHALLGSTNRVPWAAYRRILELTASLPSQLLPAARRGLGWLEEEEPLVTAALVNSPSLGQALGAFSSVLPLLTGGDRLLLRTEGSLAVVQFLDGGMTEREPFHVLASIEPLLGLVQLYGQGPAALTLGLPFHRLAAHDLALLQARTRSPIRQGTTRACLVFHADQLDRGSSFYNALLADVLQPQLRARLDGLAAAPSPRRGSLGMGSGRKLES